MKKLILAAVLILAAGNEAQAGGISFWRSAFAPAPVVVIVAPPPTTSQVIAGAMVEGLVAGATAATLTNAAPAVANPTVVVDSPEGFALDLSECKSKVAHRSVFEVLARKSTGPSDVIACLLDRSYTPEQIEHFTAVPSYAVAPPAWYECMESGADVGFCNKAFPW